MLLFKKKFLEAIRSGKKTQTVRLWVRPRMKSGQRSYIPGVGYIHIQSVEQVDIDELTDADAQPDGFPTAAALREEIRAIYAQYPDRGQKAYRIRFSLAPHETKRPNQKERRARRARSSEPLPPPVAQAGVRSTRPDTTRLELPADGFSLTQSLKKSMSP
jgi:hypothetical protein